MSSYKSVKTTQFEASKKSVSNPIGGKMIKANHGIVTAFNPRGVPLGPNGVATSHKFENKVALSR